MKTTFTARHFHASERLQAYANESVEKLSKFFDGTMDADIVLEPNEDIENPQRATITLQVARAVLVASENAKTYEMALNASVDNLKRQLIKHKEKLARV
jgi:putative sigma-54 modulation protein